MASNEDQHRHGRIPTFDGSNYSVWKVRMEAYLISLGYGVWLAVKNGYKHTTEDITDAVEMKKRENEAKAVTALLASLVSNELTRVISCPTSKEIWDKLRSVHEGDNKIKEAKLQILRSQFESLKMAEGETIEYYLNRVNGVTNAIRALGEELKEIHVVKKVLRTLPKLYNEKVSALEEITTLDSLTVDELHGILTTYEMRVIEPEPIEKEAAFEAMRNLKIKEPSEKSKAKEVSEFEDSDDELITYLARRLSKRSEKYKGKSTLKCFHCGGIGHFASKCPKKGRVYDSDDEELDESQDQKGKKKFVPKRRSLLIKNISISSDESPEDDDNEVLFMVRADELQGKKKSKKKDEVEEEPDLEAELYEALTELKTERKKNKSLSDQLNEATELITQLKVSNEEDKKISSNLENALSTKSDECTKLEEEILKLETELASSVREKRSYMEATTSTPPVTILRSKEKTVTDQEFEDDCSQIEEENILDEILSYQRSSHIKSGLGYEKQTTEKVKGKGPIENPTVFVRAKQVRSHVEKQFENKTDRDGFNTVNQHRQRKQGNNLRQSESFRGYCYGCDGYGHRVAECRRQIKQPMFTSRNRFAPLTENRIECFRCQRFGHIARNCQTLLPSQMQARENTRRNPPRRQAQREEKVMKQKARKPITMKEKAVWVEKNKEKVNQSLMVQAAIKAKSKPISWILDSGCSTHMTGDKEILSNLHVEEGRKVRFGNNDGARVEGRGTVNICSAELESQKVLLVNGLKHNILSVSQVCDQGNEVTFTKDDCVVKNIEKGKVVAQGMRTQGNLYVLLEN